MNDSSSPSYYSTPTSEVPKPHTVGRNNHEIRGKTLTKTSITLIGSELATSETNNIPSCMKIRLSDLAKLQLKYSLFFFLSLSLSEVNSEEVTDHSNSVSGMLGGSSETKVAS
jgi:hypothetical protein